MTTQSDFVIIPFNQHIGNDPNAFPAYLETRPEYSGLRSEEKPFQVNGPNQLTGDAYLLINTFGVQLATHRITINGRDLPGVDIQPSVATDPSLNKYSFNTNMDLIPDGWLNLGLNTIQVHASDYHSFDDFVVLEAVIHWRLCEPKPRLLWYLRRLFRPNQGREFKP